MRPKFEFTFVFQKEFIRKAKKTSGVVVVEAKPDPHCFSPSPASDRCNSDSVLSKAHELGVHGWKVLARSFLVELGLKKWCYKHGTLLKISWGDFVEKRLLQKQQRRVLTSREPKVMVMAAMEMLPMMDKKNKNQLGGFLMRKQPCRYEVKMFKFFFCNFISLFFVVSSFAISPPKTLTATSHLGKV